MSLRTSCAIFENINNESISEEDKAYAIRDVMEMATHDSIQKTSMIEVIKYLWNKHYEIGEN